MQAADEPATDGRKMPGGGRERTFPETLGSGPDVNAAPGPNAAKLAAGDGIALSGSGVMAAHAQEIVLDVGAHYGRLFPRGNPMSASMLEEFDHPCENVFDRRAVNVFVKHHPDCAG